MAYTHPFTQKNAAENPGRFKRWFGELTTKLLRRGTHPTVRALNADIRAWIHTWNENP